MPAPTGRVQKGDTFAMRSWTPPSTAPSPSRADAEPTALVTGPGPNTITPIDTTTGGRGTPFAFDNYEPGDIAISPDGTTAWVVGVNSDAVTPVNLATETVGSSITVGNDATKPRHHPERVDGLRGQHRTTTRSFRSILTTQTRQGPRSTWADQPGGHGHQS